MTWPDIASLVVLGLFTASVAVMAARHALRRRGTRNLSATQPASGRDDDRDGSVLSAVSLAGSAEDSEPIRQALAEDLARRYPLRVLLADDTTMNQTLIRRIFEKMGYDIKVVDDGVAAVEHAREYDYDLILMDIQMPRMDGIEACIRILEDARSRSAPMPKIVAVTANASDENRSQCMAAGMSDFIPKPFTLERLGQVVSLAIHRE